jgi:hypothetical protein
MDYSLSWKYLFKNCVLNKSEINKPMSRGSQEVRDWLSAGDLSTSVLSVLVEEYGYDDLESIARCLPEELDEMIRCVTLESDRLKLRARVADLHQSGVDEYRKSAGRHLDLDRLLSIHREGYLSLCVGDEEEWSDKFCVLEGGLLSWKKSKKSAESEGSLNLLTSVVVRMAASRVCVDGTYRFEGESLEDWFPCLMH